MRGICLFMLTQAFLRETLSAQVPWPPRQAQSRHEYQAVILYVAICTDHRTQIIMRPNRDTNLTPIEVHKEQGAEQTLSRDHQIYCIWCGTIHSISENQQKMGPTYMQESQQQENVLKAIYNDTQYDRRCFINMHVSNRCNDTGLLATMHQKA